MEKILYEGQYKEEDIEQGYLSPDGCFYITKLKNGAKIINKHDTIDTEKENNMENKTLGNINSNDATKNVKDVQFWGNGDLFKLISKASSKNEGWMKSTKAMEIEGVGCVVQVTTQQGDNVAEAVTFVPGVKIKENISKKDNIVVSRELIKL